MSKSYRVTVEEDTDGYAGCALLFVIVVVGWLIIENAGTIFKAILFIALVIGAGYCLWKGIQGARKIQKAAAYEAALEQESKSLTTVAFDDMDNAVSELSELLNSWEMMKRTQGIGTLAEGVFRQLRGNRGEPSLVHLRESEEMAVRTLSDAMSSRSAVESSREESEAPDSLSEDERQALLVEKAAVVRTADRQLRAAIFYATLYN